MIGISIFSCFLLLLLQSSPSTGFFHFIGHIHNKAPTCRDDKSMNCAKLDQMFDVCKDIHKAKTICRSFCKLCLLVDGKWADWSHWSACDVTCGDGKHTRVRTCTNPAPAHQGLECEGVKIDAKPCQRPSCPVHGGWSGWSNWSTCPVTCGIGMEVRHRNCSNPYPLRYGDHCFGDALEHRICDQKPCDDAVWGNWERWGACNPSCESGVRQRSRSCTNHIGTKCKGRALEVKLCNKHDCLNTCTFKPNNVSLNYRNVAFGKNVRLSSTHYAFIGAKMVDGDKDTFTRTDTERNPYALVDLNDVYRIFRIHIVNRKDCCANRLHDVVVQVGLEPSSLFTVARHKSAIGDECTFSFENPVRGRYVKIMLEAMEILNIGELEVFGEHVTDLN
ncbi:thrombospondin-1-like [Ruditapes philippinarum]|uniref:thrombospondin-1-like n=1 Tax=Ruditapes philippinarum TaxID=129788 RepID=UPI00295C20DC|nr:thrombospondin-1-like [Ruditapes philippinarum]